MHRNINKIIDVISSVSEYDDRYPEYRICWFNLLNCPNKSYWFNPMFDNYDRVITAYEKYQ
jgi:hypothetical protein